MCCKKRFARRRSLLISCEYFSINPINSSCVIMLFCAALVAMAIRQSSTSAGSNFSVIASSNTELVSAWADICVGAHATHACKGAGCGTGRDERKVFLCSECHVRAMVQVV